MQSIVHSFIHSLVHLSHFEPSPSSLGRVRGLKVSTHLSPVHALHFDLADRVMTSTAAPRHLTPNKLSRLLLLFIHVPTLSAVE